jgi:hypothetical protein
MDAVGSPHKVARLRRWQRADEQLTLPVQIPARRSQTHGHRYAHGREVHQFLTRRQVP